MVMLNVGDPGNPAECTKTLLSEVNHRIETELRNITRCQESIIASEERIRELSKAKGSYESILSLMGA